MSDKTPGPSVATRFHGKVLVYPDQIWKCHAPILGFETDREYLWLPHPTQGTASPFSVFQSLNRADLAFVLIGLTLTADFRALPDHLEGYGLTGEPQTWRAWAICTTYADGRPTTANLRSPLLFHPKTHRGGQIVLDDGRLSFAHPLIEPCDNRWGIAAADASGT